MKPHAKPHAKPHVNRPFMIHEGFYVTPFSGSIGSISTVYIAMGEGGCQSIDNIECQESLIGGGRLRPIYDMGLTQNPD